MLLKSPPVTGVRRLAHSTVYTNMHVIDGGRDVIYWASWTLQCQRFSWAGVDPEPCIRGVLNIIIAREAREIFETTPLFTKPRPPSARDRDQRVADMNRAPEIDLYSLKQVSSVWI